MPRKNHAQPRRPLTRSELTFWKAAFLAAEMPVVLKGRGWSPLGAAHVAREYADAAVGELRAVTARGL